jgi:hypothetical protein
MAETPRYLSQPFANAPILQDGQHMGFVVGVTLTHEGQTVTEQAEVICGADQAAALLAGPIEAFTAWSHQAVTHHDLVARANAAMDARLAAIASG